MIPPEVVMKKRGQKVRLRRKDATEKIGFCNGKVSKTGKKITCSICGVTGHNKRFHGQQGTNTNNDDNGGQTGTSTTTLPRDEVNCHDPMDGIDPQVLEDHLQLVDHLIESQFSEKITTFENVQVEPLQGIITQEQDAHNAEERRSERKKLETMRQRKKGIIEANPVLVERLLQNHCKRKTQVKNIL